MRTILGELEREDTLKKTSSDRGSTTIGSQRTHLTNGHRSATSRNSGHFGVSPEDFISVSRVIGITFLSRLNPFITVESLGSGYNTELFCNIFYIVCMIVQKKTMNK